MILSETFASGAGASPLVDKWVVTTSAACSLSNTDGEALGALPRGNPTPGLVLKCAGTIGSVAEYSSLRTIDTYLLDRPYRFAADARVDSVATFGSSPQPGMDFAIEALNNGYLYATVWIRENVVTYYIRTGSGPTSVTVTRTHTADQLFHRYEFRTNGNGTAEWYRDGALQSSTTAFVPATEQVVLRLRAPPSNPSKASEGHFDNVTVSR